MKGAVETAPFALLSDRVNRQRKLCYALLDRVRVMHTYPERSSFAYTTCRLKRAPVILDHGPCYGQSHSDAAGPGREERLEKHLQRFSRNPDSRVGDANGEAVRGRVTCAKATATSSFISAFCS
jgi:hypothetical protein